MSFETDVAHIELLETGIIKISFKSHSDVDFEALVEIMKIADELTQFKGLCAFVVPGEFTNFSKDIRDKINSSDLCQNKIAVAVIHKNLAIKLLVDFFWKMRYKTTPQRLFRNDKNAITWLRMQYELHQRQERILLKNRSKSA
ncbi:MAG: hypothetical protein R2799_08465 [Crocinitomicaceae bacterium]